MRKITQTAVEKFYNAETFKQGNTEVEVLPNVTILKLHNNAIAYSQKDVKHSNMWVEYKHDKGKVKRAEGCTYKSKKLGLVSEREGMGR